jgi:hypothetical protein
MKLRHPASFAVALCLSAAAPLASFGAAAVSDSFTGSPGAVAGQGGGAGFGGNWSGAGNVVSPGLTYPGLLTSGNKFNTAGGNAGAFRDLGAPISTDGGTIYVGFLAANSGGTAADYAGLSFYSGGQSTEELFLGKPFQVANYGFDVSGVAAQNSPTAPVTTTPSLLVYRLTFTPNGDTIDFFANPTPGGSLPATPTLTFAIPENSFADTFTSIRLQSGEGAGTGTPFSFDELRGGGSFADVAPVPEPTVIGLLGAAGLLALRRRR